MTKELKVETAEMLSASVAESVKAQTINSESRMKCLWRRIKLFLFYCAPCFLALAVILVSNFLRVRNVSNEVVYKVCQQLDSGNAPNSTSGALPIPLPTPLQKIITVVPPKQCVEVKEDTWRSDYIWGKFIERWASNALFISIFSLLPFGIMGAGLALKYNSKTQSDSGSPLKVNQPPDTPTKSHISSHENKKDEYPYYRKIAHKDFFLKFLVSSAIAWGWLYTFNPMGQAASAINDWLSTADILGFDTTPSFFKLKDSSIKHGLAAVLGWYLYLLGYFSYRFYKSDVLSTRIYNVLFKKILFVIGVALIISSVGEGSTESLLLVFLIGIFPLSAITLLTEFGNKRLSMGEDQTSLSILPGISTWQILRLEEEGIDSVSSLATSNPAALAQVISSEVISPKMLEVWIDKARLITEIGPKRWMDINGICETASHFVNKQSANDPGFIAKLSEKNIFNSDEISKTLQKTFNFKPE